MKKIGIVSLYYKNYNYGGMLQSYALPIVLKKSGYDAEQICIKFIDDRLNEDSGLKNKLKNMSIAQINEKIYKKVYKKFFLQPKNNELKHIFDERRKNFNYFQDEIIPHSEKVYENDLDDANKKYDAYICGSDQIWNETWICKTMLDRYSLGFVTDDKVRLSYAASLGTQDISSSTKELLEKNLNKFKAISVREKSAVSVLQPLVEQKVYDVCDPTLLLEKSDWDSIAKSTNIIEPYMFSYFLGEENRPDSKIKEISKFLKIKNAMIPYVHMSYNKNDTKITDIPINNAGPAEFIGMIRDAELIMTDSFHAVVFSIIYEKEFVVFKRNKDNEKGSMNSRIYDLLDEVGLRERIVDKDGSIFEIINKKIDYNKVKQRFDNKKKNSYEFLMNSIR